jgi:hypothetical protein
MVLPFAPESWTATAGFAVANPKIKLPIIRPASFLSSNFSPLDHKRLPSVKMQPEKRFGYPQFGKSERFYICQQDFKSGLNWSKGAGIPNSARQRF